jgi:hypothetical protein
VSGKTVTAQTDRAKGNTHMMAASINGAIVLCADTTHLQRCDDQHLSRSRLQFLKRHLVVGHDLDGSAAQDLLHVCVV